AARRGAAAAPAATAACHARVLGGGAATHLRRAPVDDLGEGGGHVPAHPHVHQGRVGVVARRARVRRRHLDGDAVGRVAGGVGVTVARVGSRRRRQVQVLEGVGGRRESYVLPGDGQALHGRQGGGVGRVLGVAP